MQDSKKQKESNRRPKARSSNGQMCCGFRSQSSRYWK